MDSCPSNLPIAGRSYRSVSTNSFPGTGKSTPPGHRRLTFNFNRPRPSPDAYSEHRIARTTGPGRRALGAPHCGGRLTSLGLVKARRSTASGVSSSPPGSHGELRARALSLLPSACSASASGRRSTPRSLCGRTRFSKRKTDARLHWLHNRFVTGTPQRPAPACRGHNDAPISAPIRGPVPLSRDRHCLAFGRIVLGGRNFFVIWPRRSSPVECGQPIQRLA